MTDLGWDSLETASRVREIIRKGVGKEIDRLGLDRKLIGRCINVDLTSLTSQVWFPGDDAPTDVHLFSSVIPQQWEQKGFPVAGSPSNATNGFGGMVAVERFNEKLYIVDVLTGGTVQYQPSSVGSSVSPLNADGTPGNPRETTLVVSTKQPVNVPIDGAVWFGPFLRVNPGGSKSPIGGSIRIKVENPTDTAYTRVYEFVYSSGTSFQEEIKKNSTTSNGPLDVVPSWKRIIPHQITSAGTTGSNEDWDLEIGTWISPGGWSKPGASNLVYEIWFRIINRGNAARTMDYLVTLQTGVFQTAQGMDNKYVTLVQTVAGGNFGAIGFRDSNNYIKSFAYKDDYFNRVTVGTLALFPSSAQPDWDNASANMSCNNRAQLRLTAANQELHSFNFTSDYGQDVQADFAVSATASGAAIKAGVKYNKGSGNNNFYWSAIHFNTDGTISYSINKRVAGTDTTLQSGSVTYQAVGLTYTTSSIVSIRAQYYLGVHKVTIWKETQYERLATVYTFSTDTTFPGPIPNQTQAGIIMNQAAGGTNTYPVDVYCYKWVAQLNPTYGPAVGGGNDYDAAFQKWVASAGRWRTGPWRSGYLRQGQLAQRSIRGSDQITWNGTHVKWTGRIMIGAVGYGRDGFTEGGAYITMPAQDMQMPMWPLAPFTTIPVAANGIPLNKGESLWVAIEPGQVYQDLMHYLFLTTDIPATKIPQGYDIPEWATLVAYNPADGTGNFIITGDGKEVYIPDAVDNGTWGLFAGTTTENAGNYVNMGSPGSFSFTKLRDQTRLEIDMSGTFSTGSTATGGQFGVNINSTDYDIARLPPTISAANDHFTYSGKRILARGVIPAGTYTIQGRMKRLGGAGTITTVTDDEISINAREIP